MLLGEIEQGCLVCVLVGVAVAVVVAPVVLAVGAAGVQAFLVAVVDGLADQVGAVAVGPLPVALVGVAVAVGRVVVRVVVVVVRARAPAHLLPARSEEHTSELQSLMRISYAVFC